MAQTFAELGRVEAIRQLFEGTSFKPFEEPLFSMVSDGGALATSSRLFLEGIDFNLMYFPLKHLGYKSVLAVTGELYAAMSEPLTLSVNMGVSAKLDLEHVKELWNGICTAAEEFGYKRLYLDLQPSRNGLAISVSASGYVSSWVLGSRPSPKTKDLICVSGSLGAAYLGMRLLEKERINFEKGVSERENLEQYRMLVGAYLKPEISPNIVASLEECKICPSAGYLVARGLADALKRLSRDSGLGVKVYADKIPFEGGSFSVGKELNLDPISAAMNGGEDYKLLYAIPIMQYERFRKDFQTFDIIGHLAQAQAGSVLVTPDGVELSVSAQGWPVE